jgi:4-hydroxybenzoate polyprenyltransferase/phosphoserine phosphatase
MNVPIVVDLDNTLVLTDTLDEQVAQALFCRWGVLLRALPHLLRGRAAFKAALAAGTDLSASALPLREDLVLWLRQQAARGRQIHLCSAANQKTVAALAERVGIFHDATGSGDINLKGRAKAEFLAQAFPDGFVYAGDSRADLHVWRAASGIVLAGAPNAVADAARKLGKPVEAEFANPSLTLRDALKALRVHHWSKNFLIFVPLVLGHAWTDPAAIMATLGGLACLLAVTSATYLLNDIADLESDRRHWSKHSRAIASGRLPIRRALLLSGGALGIAFAGALALSPAFALALAIYLALTLSYSFGLKRIPLFDTLIIGILFTSRLVMGIALLDQPYSEWLLTFSMFFFVSLAIAKRHTEIVRAGSAGEHSLSSRGYRAEDGALTLVIGAATATASLLVMVLYLVEEVFRHEAYGNPRMLWGVPLILAIWVGRIWLLAHRGEMTDDPVSFALRDKISLALGVSVAILFLAAL